MLLLPTKKENRSLNASKKIARSREKEEKTVRKALERGTFDDERKETVEKALSQTETATKKSDSTKHENCQCRICNKK